MFFCMEASGLTSAVPQPTLESPRPPLFSLANGKSALLSGRRRLPGQGTALGLASSRERLRLAQYALVRLSDLSGVESARRRCNVLQVQEAHLSTRRR